MIRCIIMIMAMILCGCIPVTIRPEFDDKGKPIAIPVTPVGSQDMTTGQFKPIYPVSNESPTPPTDWWPLAEKGLMVVLGLLTGTGAGVVMVRRAKTALKIACDLADANAEAETDEEVQKNKGIAEARQLKAGVQTLTQKVRGK